MANTKVFPAQLVGQESLDNKFFSQLSKSKSGNGSYASSSSSRKKEQRFRPFYDIVIPFEFFEKLANHYGKIRNIKTQDTAIAEI